MQVIALIGDQGVVRRILELKEFDMQVSLLAK